MRVLFVIPSFKIGGTIVSLHSLLSKLDPSQVRVDVFAQSRAGEYRDMLPNCSLIPENIWLSSEILESGKIKNIGSLSIRALRRVLRALHIETMPVLCYFFGKKFKTEQYDAVVSYQEILTPLVSFIPSKNHIACIHCDYSRYQTLIGGKDESKYFERYNKVFIDSEFARQQFNRCVPSAASKSVVVNNVINEESIREKAKGEIDDSMFDNSCFTIVSAGRMDPVKQFELIPTIAAKMKTLTDIPFKWYIIGGSRGFESVEQKIIDDTKHLGVQDNVIRLSEKKNVYPYIWKANLFVNTSKSEAFSLVVFEAKALGVPSLINDFGVSGEIIKNDIDGFITPIDRMAERIVNLMEDPNKLEDVKNYLTEHPYDNDSIINKVMGFLVA